MCIRIRNIGHMLVLFAVINQPHGDLSTVITVITVISLFAFFAFRISAVAVEAVL